jgi:hypothetical protein
MIASKLVHVRTLQALLLPDAAVVAQAARLRAQTYSFALAALTQMAV